MKEYIERDALVKTTEETPFTMSMFSTVDECKGANMARLTLAAIFKILPTADVVEVRHGRWVKSGQSFVYPHKFRNYSCSMCGYDIEKAKCNYCPNCGARMDGGADN